MLAPPNQADVDAALSDPTIRLASTIMLLRDSERGAGGEANPVLEVLMVQRHHRIDFATGALVFPGGKVETGDDGAGMRPLCAGAETLSDRALSLRVAAIRETFEEAGVLLARGRAESDLIDAARLADLETRCRGALASGDLDMADFVRSEDLQLACDLLVPFAHWITPPVMPKRFDTHFFLVAAPRDQLALHDGREAVDSVWTTVADALAAEARGERTIIFPTLSNLKKLGRHRCVADALTAARRGVIVPVLPWVGQDDTGELSLFIAEEADYDVTHTSLAALRG